jgi:membrane protein YqaA with SNARE-associated domain
MLLLGVATAGNVLGAVVNWGLGRFLTRFVDRRWFPVIAQSLHKAQDMYARYGWPSLLLSWVPVIGDPMTIAAGLMREPLWRFLIVVTAAKGGRYVVLASGVAALT